MNKEMKLGLLFFILLSIINPTIEVHASELEFKGNLLDRPCQIDPAAASQDIIFLDTANSLYNAWPGKSNEKEFKINLINCHFTTIGKMVELTFTGTEELALPGYLQVSGVNKGMLGIGIIDTDGHSLLKLNQIYNGGRGVKIENSNISFVFKAFVQATPKAIENKAVQPGTYSSIATFEVSYK